MREKEDLSLLDLANEVTTILFAGHDTTAHALALCVGLLAKHEKVWYRCKEEVNSRGGKISGDSDPEEQFPYLHQCIKETLRLYPSVPMVARRTDRPLEFCGIRFPAQTWFCLNFYSLHRHKDFWKDPEQFQPDRFSPENISDIKPFTYLPFSTGPRNCLGMKLATIQMFHCLVTLIATFDRVECVELGEVCTDCVLRPEAVKLRFFR